MKKVKYCWIDGRHGLTLANYKDKDSLIKIGKILGAKIKRKGLWLEILFTKKGLKLFGEMYGEIKRIREIRNKTGD